MELPPATAIALRELCAGVRARFGVRVERLALFGSRARGDATEDSDVDIVIVIDGLISGEAREIDALVGDLLTRHDVLLSPLVVSKAHFDQWRDRERLIAREIEQDGVAL